MNAKDERSEKKDEKTPPKSRKKKTTRRRKKTGKKPPAWGDGDRELAGDKRVTKWLEFRGFGEYAAAFAARGITLDGLKTPTMSDLEDVPVEGAATREKSSRGGGGVRQEAAERAAKRAEKAGPSEPPKKKTKTAPPAAGVKPQREVLRCSRREACDVTVLALFVEQPNSTKKRIRVILVLFSSVSARAVRAR